MSLTRAEREANAERAARAQTALEGYARATGIDPDDGIDLTQAVDLLADLLHLLGRDFEAALTTARIHHHDETTGRI